MRLYPCRKKGKIATLAPISDFKGIEKFNSEKGGLAANKKERELLLKVGLNIEKENLDGGSMWIEVPAAKQLKAKLEKLEELKDTEKAIINNIIKFFDICIQEGYSVRVY